MRRFEELMNLKYPIEQIKVSFIEESVLDEALASVSGCESCDDTAALSFDYLLDFITECDPRISEPLMCRPAKCPRCLGEIREKTHVTVR